MKKLISSLLTLTMLLSIFCGVISFGGSAEFDDSHYSYTQLPGVQDWTDETLSAYNAVTEAAKNDSNVKSSGTSASLVNTHTKGSATQAIKLTLDGTPSSYMAAFSTKGDPDDVVQSQLGDVFGKYDTLADICNFTGIRVAVVNENGERPNLSVAGKSSDSYVSLRIVGTNSDNYGASWANGCVPWLTGKTYEAKANGSAIAESEAVVYHDGYYYFYFDNFLSGWGGDMRTLLKDSQWAYMWKYSNMYLSFNSAEGFNASTSNGGALYISDMQFFTVIENVAERDDLIDIIAKIIELDVNNVYSAEIEEAQKLCDDITADRRAIEAKVSELSEIYQSLISSSGNFNSESIATSFGAVADPKENADSGPVKLLMIGNSFSCNAFNYIKQIADKAGIELIAANLNIGGCNLQKHYTCLINDSKSYGYQNTWSSTDNYSISMALKDYDWDYISIQQVSGYSGDYDSYQPYLHNIVTRLREMAPNAEIIWHQTWAYHQDSTHSDFPKYDRNQTKMWEAIESTSKLAAKEEDINYIVPSGKAFQLVRATEFGDNLTSDGYHANAVGEYIAGHCFLSTITGVMPTLDSYRPVGIDEKEHKLINNAIISAVTEYGYVNYDKTSEYLNAIRLFNEVTNDSLDGMMVAGNLVAESTDALNSFKAITLNVLKNSNVMFTLGESDKASNKNAPLFFSTVLSEFYKNDLQPTAQKRKGNRHFTVDGIHLLGVAYDKVTDGFATYSDETLQWLDSELAAIDSGKPIFVVTSFPVSHTTGSVGASRICDILKKYDNVIVFSGGVNGTTENDILIHSDGFVSVNVGSLADEAYNGILVDVDTEGDVRIRRYDIDSSKETARYIINFDGSNLSDYSAGYYQTPVINLENGASFDLADGEPSITWLQDGEKATLNGQPYEYGAPITEAGEYTLTVTAGDKYSTVTFTVVDNRITYTKGDFDNDGKITVSDALAALRIAAKMIEGTELDLLIGDIDADGKITVSDSLAILRVAAKMADSL